jgi:hypothetical protein
MHSHLFGFGDRPDALRAAHDAERLARNADSESRLLGRTVEHLTDVLQRLLLVNQAMWQLLQQRTGATEAELLDTMQEIDLRDGQLDGKVTQRRTCAACKRVLSKRSRRCLYCGAEAEDATPFPAI